MIRLTRWARDHYTRFIKVRSELGNLYGEKLGENVFRVSSGKVSEYLKAIGPVRAEVVDIDTSLLIDVHQLTGVKLTPASMLALESFLSSL